MTEDDILYDTGRFWVRRELVGSGRFKPQSVSFLVDQTGATHSTRVSAMPTLERAKAEADRREQEHA